MHIGIGWQGCETTLKELKHLDAVVSWTNSAKSYRRALAGRDGPIVPLLCGESFEHWLLLERHACIDTTAAGGNAALLGGTE